MYQQPNHSFDSTQSRRLSSNNPFRFMNNNGNGSNSNNNSSGNLSRPNMNRTASDRSTGNQAFEDWVEKNKVLIDISSDEENDEIYNNHTKISNNKSSNSNNNNNNYNYDQSNDQFVQPNFPAKPVRTGSDSSVNYNRYV